jgi:cobalt-zinc-cadmium efflux system outer membrane protein
MRFISIIIHTAASISLIASYCLAETRLDFIASEPIRLPSVTVEPAQPPSIDPAPLPLPNPSQPQVFDNPPLHDSQVEPRLTLETLETLALASNPAVERAEAQVRALHGKWTQSGLYPNPVLGYSGDEMGDSGTAGKQGGFVQQEIVTAGKLGAHREVVAREIEQAQQQLAAQKLRVLTDVRAAYYDVLLAQERIKVTRRIAGLSERASETVARLLEARQSARVELLQADVETETSRVGASRAENDHIAAWRRLAAVTGTPDRAIAQVEGDWAAPPPPADWDTLVQELLQNSPEVAGALIGVQRARSSLQQACADSKPNIDLSTSVHKDNTTGDTITSVQVGVPIPVFNRNQGAIQQAQAEITAADRDAERVALDLQQRLATVYQRLVDAQIQATRYHDIILPKSEESLRLVTAGYEVGEISYLNLLTAQRTYFQTSLQYLDVLREAWASHVEIKGLLLSGSLSSSL